MTDTHNADIEATFREAEATGLRLAIKGRFVTLLLVAVWMAATRSSPVVAGYLSGLSVLALLGVVHYYIIGSR
ncbi:MAG: hypothetical protein CL569_14935 [Alphaproteobacteria bacterium]|nr:hypothetical protein [Alphaproteobacteria bacterium]|tara:strand:- start:289 stop:507 length:219 start_codon:yes stop_codon:yes gene_type:complete